VLNKLNILNGKVENLQEQTNNINTQMEILRKEYGKYFNDNKCSSVEQI
jgi:hypothetical protein